MKSEDTEPSDPIQDSSESSESREMLSGAVLLLFGAWVWLVVVTWPVLFIATIAAAAWWITKSSVQPIAASIRSVALPVSTGLLILLLAEFILNSFAKDINRSWVLQAENSLVLAERTLGSWLKIATWQSGVTIAGLVGIALLIPRWRISTKALHFRGLATCVLVFLIALTSFTFFSPNSLAEWNPDEDAEMQNRFDLAWRQESETNAAQSAAHFITQAIEVADPKDWAPLTNALDQLVSMDTAEYFNGRFYRNGTVTDAVRREVAFELGLEFAGLSSKSLAAERFLTGTDGGRRNVEDVPRPPAVERAVGSGKLSDWLARLKAVQLQESESAQDLSRSRQVRDVAKAAFLDSIGTILPEVKPLAEVFINAWIGGLAGESFDRVVEARMNLEISFPRTSVAIFRPTSISVDRIRTVISESRDSAMRVAFSQERSSRTRSIFERAKERGRVRLRR